MRLVSKFYSLLTRSYPCTAGLHDTTTKTRTQYGPRCERCHERFMDVKATRNTINFLHNTGGIGGQLVALISGRLLGGISQTCEW